MVVSRVFTSCISCTTNSHDLPSNEMSEKKLTKKINQNYKENPSEWKPTGTCFVSAFNAAYCEGQLPETTKKNILSILTDPEHAYGDLYKKSMGIDASSERTVFDLSLITESGLINFIRDGEIRHTAFLQKTDSEEVVLYHSNYVTLDHNLCGSNPPTMVGPMTKYNLTDGKQGDFNDWLSKETFTHVFTPMSKVVSP